MCYTTRPIITCEGSQHFALPSGTGQIGRLPLSLDVSFGVTSGSWPNWTPHRLSPQKQI
jgi:hypothetical protein